MEVLKQAVAIPLFGTVIWLVWVFNQTAAASSLIFLLIAFLLLAIAGWILGRWPAKSAATASAVIVLVFAVAVPVWALRTLTPSAATRVQDARWQPFTPDLVAKYRAEGRPVFVDFTASWCLSCQVNERVVLDRADVQQRLQSSGVELVRADWTRHDETIANALAALGRSGVPTYALYSADPNAPPQLLPEVLTPGIVLHALDAVQPTAAHLRR
jgi:thiol:disulfide interchange protein DsbD